MYDIKPESGKFGLTDNSIKLGPEETQVFTGFDFNVSARLPRGVVLSGGTSTGRGLSNDCYKLGHPEYTLSAANAPRTEAYCNPDVPYQTQIKAYGVYPLPWWGIRTSATFRSVPGSQIAANAPITSTEIASSSTLGRRLTGGVATVTVNLVAPGNSVRCDPPAD